jgi:hypothetical protein
MYFGNLKQDFPALFNAGDRSSDQACARSRNASDIRAPPIGALNLAQKIGYLLWATA